MEFLDNDNNSLDDLFNMEVEDEKSRRRGFWLFFPLLGVLGFLGWSMFGSGNSSDVGFESGEGFYTAPAGDVATDIAARPGSDNGSTGNTVAVAKPSGDADSDGTLSFPTTSVTETTSVAETTSTVGTPDTTEVPVTTDAPTSGSTPNTSSTTTTTVAPTTTTSTTTTTTTSTTTTSTTTTTAPPTAPDAPADFTVSASEQADSTPTVRFTWASQSGVSELEYNYFNGSTWSDWTAISTSTTNSGYLSAGFGTTHRYEVRARNCGAGGCSNWTTSNTAVESVGSPASNASTPSKPTINTTGTAYDSSYFYQFGWNNVGASEQQCSYNGAAYVPCSGTSWSGTAGAGQTKSLKVKVRNTATPNVYGGGADSAWVEADLKSVTFGSPASTTRPSAFTVSGSAGDLFANFSWSVAHNGQQQCSTDNGSSWSACSSYSVSLPSYSTTYTLKVRVSNYTAPNAYGGGGYSDWRESNNASITTPAPPGPTVTGWKRWKSTDNTPLGSIPRYHVYVYFSGTAHVQFFHDANCSGTGSNVYTNRTGSTGTDTTAVSGWVYNTYNGGSALLTDPSTGATTCQNTPEDGKANPSTTEWPWYTLTL